MNYYKTEIINLIQNCDNSHWLEVIYTFVKRLKSVKRICVLLVRYVCATHQNPPLFQKILGISDIRKTPENQGFPRF